MFWEIGNIKLLIFIAIAFLLFSCNKQLSEHDEFILPFDEVYRSVDIIYDGMQYLSTDTNNRPRIIRSGYNYQNNTFGETISFEIGLSSISMYYATGDKKYIDIARETATLLDSLLPNNGLIPEYYLDCTINPNSIVYSGTSGQSNILCYICALSAIDSSFISLSGRLADGLLNYCINPVNNLAYFQVNSSNGTPYFSNIYGYESQLGSASCAVAQALIFAYEINPKEIRYLNKAYKILESIWDLRNRSTNLIPECYDVCLNKSAEKLYPCCNEFRYDDMGGVYIRTLTYAYQQNHDPGILNILNSYIKSLLRYTWDNDIGDGGFRYLNNLDGNGPPQVETMYGLFIATLIEASEYFDSTVKEMIIERCLTHANNVYLTNYGIKNLMIPHNISKGGKYTNKSSDSQLAYAVVQFPLGMGLLTQKTDDQSYLFRTNQIINTLLERHRIGDNVNSPSGFVTILETTPPYGFEENYSSASWCVQMMYLPAYMLFAGILPNENVKINWINGSIGPFVFGLVTGMPFWNLENVSFNIKNKVLCLNDVFSFNNGEINFDLLGYQGIASASCDGEPYFSFKNNILYTKAGNHAYQIHFNNSL